MDLISVVRRSHYEESPRKRQRLNTGNSPWENESDIGVTACAVSPQNVIAFACYGTLKSSTAGPSDQNMNVVVCDANTPWDTHIVKSCVAQVTVLEWDQSGHYLLIGDTAGNAEIWTTLTHLLNEWTRVANICIPDEPIQAGMFFFNGKKTFLNCQNRESVSYLDKYIQVDMKPTIRGFGGRPLQGFLVVGMTGLVQAFVMGGTKGKTTNVEILGGIRLAYSFVDLAWTKDGEILAVACTGIPLDPIVYCKLTIQKDDGVEFSCLLDEYRLRSETLTGLFPLQSGANEMRVCGVNFSSREDPSGIFLVVNGINSGTLQYWELSEVERTIHSLFSTSAAMSRFLQWQCMSVFNCNSRITYVCPSRNVWVNGQEAGSPPQHHLVIATVCGELLCLHRESMKQVGHLSIVDRSKCESAQLKTVSSACFTATGNALIAFDNTATMFVCKLSPITDPGAAVTIPYALMSLEYCLLTGIDYWDVLIGLRSTMLDSLCERLTDSFNQQSIGLQQLLQYRLLNIKLAIFRLGPTASSKAGLQYGIIMLNSVYYALKSLLRPPSELFNQDRAPADSLTAVLSSKVPEVGTEVDKVLLHLEVKEFTVEASTLITVQHLIQWTVTFILRLLNNLPDWRTATTTRGTMCDMLRDPKLLNMFRELLVIFRIWGLIRHSCLPTFSYMENVDVIATLFRILTRLLQTSEPDESLLDECCQLSSQLIIPDIGLSLPARGIASPTLFNQLPLQYEYGSHPEEPSSTKYDGVEGESKVDSIRHVYLGSKPHNVRYCSRCKGISIVVKGLRVGRSNAAKSWDMRWQMSCICRGKWSRQEVQ
ncbi:mediator of RNA polymerase II transcription subunit 16-like [Daphnia pulicaria]|uniref:mediator of RNA polymerase II transcription subunit 16-like n=1 Tax=Daphnia pulicaria TaxID=35523 RepID=UPI001EEC7855|nr:mediator of RNA polymerase II transcription subunit 16-like [Daphnia pulicaria]